MFDAKLKNFGDGQQLPFRSRGRRSEQPESGLERRGLRSGRPAWFRDGVDERAAERAASGDLELRSLSSRQRRGPRRARQRIRPPSRAALLARQRDGRLHELLVSTNKYEKLNYFII